MAHLEAVRAVRGARARDERLGVAPGRAAVRADEARRRDAGGLCGEEVGRPDSPGVVLEQCQRIDHEGVAEEVDPLAAVADGVGSAEEAGVVEVAVDALGVVALPEQAGEVGVAGRNGREVLGPVEAPIGVGVVAVEADGDGAAPEALFFDPGGRGRHSDAASGLATVWPLTEIVGSARGRRLGRTGRGDRPGNE